MKLNELCMAALRDSTVEPRSRSFILEVGPEAWINFVGIRIGWACESEFELPETEVPSTTALIKSVMAGDEKAATDLNVRYLALYRAAIVNRERSNG